MPAGLRKASPDWKSTRGRASSAGSSAASACIGYRFGPEGRSVAKKPVENFVARAIRLYGQEPVEACAFARRRPIRAMERRRADALELETIRISRGPRPCAADHGVTKLVLIDGVQNGAIQEIGLAVCDNRRAVWEDIAFFVGRQPVPGILQGDREPGNVGSGGTMPSRACALQTLYAPCRPVTAKPAVAKSPLYVEEVTKTVFMPAAASRAHMDDPSGSY